MSRRSRDESSLRAIATAIGLLAALSGCLVPLPGNNPGKLDGGTSSSDAGRDAGSSTTDGGAFVEADSGAPVDTDSGAFVEVDSGVPVEADSGVPVETDSGAPFATPFSERRLFLRSAAC